MRARFRYEGDARSVRVRGAVEALGDTELTRDDGVWTLELDVPDDVRTIYWLALDGATDWLDWLPDAGNASRYVYPQGLEFTRERAVEGSLLEGPDARPYFWSVDRGAPRGTVREHERDGRRVWTYEPAVPAEGRLLLFDGNEYLTLARIDLTLDNLIAEGRIPPLAAVLPDNVDTEARLRDLDCNAGFLAWCCGQLPEAPAERSVVAGCSIGGRSAIWFGIERPDLFGAVLAQSPVPFGLEVPPGLPLRWYLDVGTLEELAEPVRALRDDLRGAGYEVVHAEFAGGHDYFWWRETIADGLVALLGGR
jgi:putative esterase